MTSATTPRCTHGVLSLDTPDSVRWGVFTVGEPSQDLLDRAYAGWIRFTGADEESSDV
ncbi:hypothetical protein ABZX75_08315 [Streptomyces sp. NPDC003038]|uniref:hypothetical protein n=1 Tax=unclassified Streptomyces TaxID=2593676 RepID=UPI0033A3D5F3